MQEIVQTGKKFKVLHNVTDRIWHVISFWTKASDVEFESGQNAQTTLGNIAGISDSLISDASDVAASAKAVKDLNDKITQLSSDMNDKLYNAFVSAGVKPKDKTTNALIAAVTTLKNKPKATSIYLEVYSDRTWVFHNSISGGKVDVWVGEWRTINLSV